MTRADQNIRSLLRPRYTNATTKQKGGYSGPYVSITTLQKHTCRTAFEADLTINKQQHSKL